jgi:hypothetical protein
MTISGIFQGYVKVLVNATVKVAVVPNVNIGVADAPVPPLPGVNTKSRCCSVILTSVSNVYTCYRCSY